MSIIRVLKYTGFEDLFFSQTVSFAQLFTVQVNRCGKYSFQIK